MIPITVKVGGIKTERKISAMHKQFGIYTGKEPETCKSCSNLQKYHYHGKNYRKCCVYGESHSEATDWNLSYEACGMFNRPYHGTELLKVLSHSKKEEVYVPLPGQMNIEEFISPIRD